MQKQELSTSFQLHPSLQVSRADCDLKDALLESTRRRMRVVAGGISDVSLLFDLCCHGE